MHEAFSRRPFALMGADVSSLVPSLSNPDLKSVIEVISTQVNDIYKEWVAKWVATGVVVEPSVLMWGYVVHPKRCARKLSSSGCDPAPPKEDVLLVVKALSELAYDGPGCGK